MELTDLLQSAQTALDKGEYRLAETATRHILATFPSCLSAHRMLGEACLEQGNAAEAAEHFGRALTLDPLHVVARLGLGVAMEERGDLDAAYAAYLRAWELNPTLDSVRDELLRLRSTLNDRLPIEGPARSDGLHRTRFGLATIHARNGQLTRAVAEWRAVLAATPACESAQTDLAEALWRQGDDPAALQSCHQIIEQNPEALRALAIRAEIEHRHAALEAPASAEAYQRLDPAGEIVAILVSQKIDANLSWLMPESAALPQFDPAAVAAAEEQPEPVQEPNTPPAGTPIDLAASAPAQQLPAPDLWDNLVRDITGELTLVRSADQTDRVEPFVWSADHDPVSEAESEVSVGFAASPDGATLAVNGHGSSQPAAAVALLERPGSVEQGVDDVTLIRSESRRPTQPAGIDQFITADGGVDLTVGWDDLDRALAAARPGTEPLPESDLLLAELTADGIAPFDAVASSGDEEAWEPFGEADFAPPLETAEERAPVPKEATSFSYLPDAPDVFARSDATPRSRESTDPFEIAALTANWDAVEQELAAAIPAETASGYTEVLRNLGVEHLQPFQAEEAIDTFIPPDVTGKPLAFHDLLEVGGPEEPYAVADSATVVLMPDPELGTTEALELAALEPFTFDDLTPASDGDSFDFSDLVAPVPVVTSRDAVTGTIGPVASLDSTLGDASRPRDGQWPAFVAENSELVDRYGDVGALFARLREEKVALVGLGMLHVDRSLADRPGNDSVNPTTEIIVAAAESAEAVEATATLRPIDAALAAEASELRRRMQFGQQETGELVATVEARFTGAEGEQPLARLLGEAYLAQGRGDLAAAHFRAARSWRAAVRS